MLQEAPAASGSASTGEGTNRRLKLWMIGVFLLCFVYVLPRPGTVNVDSRLDLILAIANHGHAWTDQYRWNAGPDTISHGRHFYAAKAPGQSLAGLPLFMVYKGVMTLAGDAKDVQQLGLRSTWKRLSEQFYLLQFLETVWMVEVPAAFFLLFFFWFLGYFSSSLLNRLLLTFGVGLATSFFSFASTFYTHTPDACMVFAGFALIYMAGRRSRGLPPRSPRLEGHPAVTALLAGICLGCAAFYDPTAAIPAGIIVLYGLVWLPFALWPFLAAGGLPFLLGTFAYDKLAFDDAGVSAYNTAVNGTVQHMGKVIPQSGVGGAPAGRTIYPEALWGLSFSPYRGLFFSSPFLLLTLPGLWLWKRRGGWEWLVCLLGPVALFLFISTVSYWHGANSVGPRYLVEIIPLFALPIIFVLDRIRSVWLSVGVAILFVLSFANVWVQTVSGMYMPWSSDVNPLFNTSIPAFVRGDLALNVGSVLTAPFVGIHSLWSLLPLPILLGLWTLYCARPRRAQKQPAMEAAEAPAAS